MTLSEIRRRPNLPGRFQPSTIGAKELNFCVRDGNRWNLLAITTGNASGLALTTAQTKLTPEPGFRMFCSKIKRSTY